MPPQQKKYRHAVAALVLKPTDVCLPAKGAKAGECATVYQLLLVHKPRVHDAWQLPQGGVEAGETIGQAAMRELKEETGLSFAAVHHVSDATYCYDFPRGFLKRYKPTNVGQKLCFVTFVCDRRATITVDNREIDTFAWVTPEQLPLYLKRAEYLKVVKELLEESRGLLPDSCR